jgi:hypothetical protein
MDVNKKLIDQLSDLSRNIKSLTNEVKNNNISNESDNSSKENISDKKNKLSTEEQNSNFLKSLEDIFKKGISQMTKSNLESSNDIKNQVKGNLPKGLESISKYIPDVKEKKLSEIIGKIPAFESGGVMDKNGLAMVGEKGPEIVKLEKGDNVIPTDKISQLLNQKPDDLKKFKPTPLETADQNLNPDNKKNKEIDLEEIRSKLLSGDIGDYSKYLEELKYNITNQLNGKDYESFTKENIQGLNKPIPKIENASVIDEKNKEEKEKPKKESKLKNLKDLLNPKDKEKNKESASTEREGIIDKGKELLVKNKNVLLDNKDSLTNKSPLESAGKIASSLLSNKNPLLSKGIGIATSLIGNKDKKDQENEKLKDVKDVLKKKNPIAEKSNMSQELPELKKIPVKQNKEEKPEVKNEIKPNTPRENKKEEKKEGVKNKEETKTVASSNSTKKEEKYNGVNSSDLDDIKSLLLKMVTLLEGPLFMETMDSPFRPDSRRF